MGNMRITAVLTSGHLHKLGSFALSFVTQKKNYKKKQKLGSFAVSFVTQKKIIKKTKTRLISQLLVVVNGEMPAVVSRHQHGNTVQEHILLSL